MTKNDIIRLNRMYKCEKKIDDEKAKEHKKNKKRDKKIRKKNKYNLKKLKKLAKQKKGKDAVESLENVDLSELIDEEFDVTNDFNDVDNKTLNSDSSNIDEQLVETTEHEMKDIFMKDLDKKIGDMILSKNQIDFLYSGRKSKFRSTNDYFNRWPDAIVYYKFDQAGPLRLKKKVSAAMKYIENISCIQFKVQSKDAKHKNYVQIKSNIGCSSNVGMRKVGMQALYINADKCTKGNIVHELLHTLGFLHMHTANGRDHHINIKWDNVMESKKTEFKQISSYVSMFDTTYDISSIMHYPPMSFAIDKSIPTIVSLDPSKDENMGQRKSK